MPRTILALATLVVPPLLTTLPGAPKGRGADGPAAVAVSTDPADWSMYNYDVLGTRHNVGEKHLGPGNVARLEEKWRFPAPGAKERVGVVHATPVVVGGHVYVGTSTLATFYKLTPDGQVKWSYQNPDFTSGKAPSAAFGLPTTGFMNSPLVTQDTVYVGDVGGYIYALDRDTGAERWKINTRAGPFLGAHSSNCVFAAPILADGKIVVAGGGFEHGVAANPRHRSATGRGFVVALEPRTGKVVWKYDVGPEPQPLDPPVKMRDVSGKERTFYFGPSTSSVWSTPSYDAASQTIFFGTDCHNSPRQPTKDDPRLYTKHSCAVIAVDARTGGEKWVTQVNPDDVWNYALPMYDSKAGRYKDQSIGDTPKLYTIAVDGKPTRVVGAGCKNGGYYVFDAATGRLLHQTPVYGGPPANPPSPPPDPRTLALPSAIGGLQTGCATDGKAVYTNGIDFLMLGTPARPRQPTGGRVVSIGLDTRKENWRHERPKVKAVGGTKEKPAFTDVGDPVGSGIALANGVAYFTTTVSNRLVAVDTADGKVLKEIPLGPVWCGPSVSRGRVYVGTGNVLFSPGDPGEAFFAKSYTGAVICFGLPGEDEVSRLGARHP